MGKISFLASKSAFLLPVRVDYTSNNYMSEGNALTIVGGTGDMEI